MAMIRKRFSYSIAGEYPTSDSRSGIKGSNADANEDSKGRRDIIAYGRTFRTRRGRDVIFCISCCTLVVFWFHRGFVIMMRKGSPAINKHKMVVFMDGPPFDPEALRVTTTSIARALKVPLSNEEIDLKFSVDKETDVYLKAEWERESFLNKIDGILEAEFAPQSSDTDRETKCRLPAYMSNSFPTCNSLHELAKESGDGMEVSFLNHGFYRDALRYRWYSYPSNTDHFVLKRMRYKRSIGAKPLAKVHKEAVILERLSQSPHILDIYSYCGSSVIVEAMASDINNRIVPTEGYILQKKLDRLQTEDVHPLNNLTVSEKLQIALYMAEALADVHGFGGGVIVHADVHVDQWLVAPDGSVKLNDFGDAYPALWSRSKNKYCFRKDLGHSGTWKAPEEYEGRLNEEAIDVYAFGNIVYSLLTGLWPFYDEEYREVDHRVTRWKMIKNGKRPYVDQRYRTHSYIESNLVRIMEKCWAPKDDRISIFEVVGMLRSVKVVAATKGLLQASDVIKIPLSAL